MNSFGSRSVFRAGKREFEIYRLDVLEKQGCATNHLPFSLRILLENLLRREDGKTVKADDVRALTSWTKKSHPSQEIAFMPSRVLLAGLHRRSGGGRSGSDARRYEGAGRRSHADQSAAAGGTRHRPLGAGR